MTKKTKLNKNKNAVATKKLDTKIKTKGLVVSRYRISKSLSEKVEEQGAQTALPLTIS